MALFPTMDAFGVQPDDPNLVRVQAPPGFDQKYPRVGPAPTQAGPQQQRGPAPSGTGTTPSGSLPFPPPKGATGTGGGRVFQHVPPWIKPDTMTGMDPDTKQWGTLTQDKYGFEFKPYPKDIQERINPDYDTVEADIPGFPGKMKIKREAYEKMATDRAQQVYKDDRAVLDAYRKANEPKWNNTRTGLAMMDAYFNRPGFKSGKPEALSLDARKFFGDLGWLSDSAQQTLDGQVAFRSLALKIAQGERVAGTGAQTDRDYGYLLEQTPQLGNSYKANVAIAARMKQEQDYVERWQQAREKHVNSGKALATFSTDGTDLDGMFPRYKPVLDKHLGGVDPNDARAVEAATAKARTEWDKTFRKLKPGMVFLDQNDEYQYVPIPDPKP
jgi:hypothetical protein